MQAPEKVPRPARRARARTGLALLTIGLAASATVLAGGNGGGGKGGGHHHDKPKVVTGFAGPLPGLTLGSKGNLLVADQSVGIVPIRRGAPGTPIVLPGVTDMSVHGSTIWALTGAGGPPPEGPQNDTGQGLHVIANGKVQKIVNLFQFEAAYNPHTAAPPNAPDSNPYDVQALGPHAALVADAGGNDLLRIDRSGNVKVLAVFPDEVVPTANIKSLAGCPASAAPFCSLPEALPAQPVPTSIAIDKHGYIYVGELKGFPAPAGESNIWRISPKADGARCGQSPDCVKVFDGGFTSVIDLAFGPDGQLYVTEFDEGAWAAVEIFGTPKGGTINACNLKSKKCTEVKKGILEPTAIAFDKNGALWSTQKALVPNGGEVVRIASGGKPRK